MNNGTPPETGTDVGPDVADFGSGRVRAGVTTAVDETDDRPVDGDVGAAASVAAGCAVRARDDDAHAPHSTISTARATHRTSPRRTPS
jgi:hypothetical protein